MNQYYNCSVCGLKNITKRNKSGMCRSCKIKTIPSIKKKDRICSSCGRTKIDSRNKSGLCRRCKDRNAYTNRYSICTQCRSEEVYYKNKSGICVKCKRLNVISKKVFCKICKTKELQKNVKGGICNKCIDKKLPKCSFCSQKIGYRNKSGLCREHKNELNKKNFFENHLKCSVCKLVNIKKNKSGMCRKCYMKNVFKYSEKPVCSKCNKKISYNNMSGICIECRRLKTHNKFIKKNKVNKTKKKSSIPLYSRIKCLDCDKMIVKQSINSKRCILCYKKYLKDKKSIYKCNFCGKGYNNNKNISKYCSRNCFNKQRIADSEKKKLLELETQYENKKVINKNYCEEHDIFYIRGENCIKCIMEMKKKADTKKKLSGRWKECADCSTLIPKTKTRCSNCMSKNFEKKYGN